MLDDFRSSLEDEFEEEEKELDIPINFDEIEAQQQVTEPERKFLGMTAGERAFLAIIVFLIVLVFAIAILAVTGRISL